MAKHGTVKAALAQSCIENYHKIFKSTVDKDISDAFTSDLVFDKAELLAWLTSIDADSVKISLGVYTKDFAAEYSKAKLNRLTTFLFPHNSAGTAVKAQGGDGDGSDDPFNLADMNP